ncbi:hypothetical protein PIROE2DRAFT_11994 [Piromyces sp. E2]|nr:hypothetical protein PIROE2DRAFT_11994 [Piromyces sp. E2]|eukprot:OUM61881.1 hypothetical protein PIROE2DRAFT_11994 [Piromyces sp. E2]
MAYIGSKYCCGGLFTDDDDIVLIDLCKKKMINLIFQWTDTNEMTFDITKCHSQSNLIHF